ncbi:MAG: hypothetical protein J0H68_01200 [Sphingobacteriia bacterium]|nr:hypothetical protein [Sphingobacteriia bacterium]
MINQEQQGKFPNFDMVKYFKRVVKIAYYISTIRIEYSNSGNANFYFDTEYCNLNSSIQRSLEKGPNIFHSLIPSDNSLLLNYYSNEINFFYTPLGKFQISSGKLDPLIISHLIQKFGLSKTDVIPHTFISIGTINFSFTKDVEGKLFNAPSKNLDKITLNYYESEKIWEYIDNSIFNELEDYLQKLSYLRFEALPEYESLVQLFNTFYSTEEELTTLNKFLQTFANEYQHKDYYIHIIAKSQKKLSISSKDMKNNKENSSNSPRRENVEPGRQRSHTVGSEASLFNNDKDYDSSRSPSPLRERPISSSTPSSPRQKKSYNKKFSNSDDKIINAKSMPILNLNNITSENEYKKSPKIESSRFDSPKSPRLIAIQLPKKKNSPRSSNTNVSTPTSTLASPTNATLKDNNDSVSRERSNSLTETSTNNTNSIRASFFKKPTKSLTDMLKQPSSNSVEPKTSESHRRNRDNQINKEIRENQK